MKYNYLVDVLKRKGFHQGIDNDWYYEDGYACGMHIKDYMLRDFQNYVNEIAKDMNLTTEICQNFFESIVTKEYYREILSIKIEIAKQDLYLDEL